jgi:hypothetical protein
MATCTDNQQGGLSCSELFFWIAADKTLDQLGVDDVGAVVAILIGQPVIPTRQVQSCHERSFCSILR